ncbi:MAG: phospholipase D family protein [Planctomycetota bacterium]
MRYLNTSGLSSELEHLIRNARKNIVLVSPYLDISQRIRDLVEYKRDVPVILIYGKRDPKQSAQEWISAQANVKTYFVPDLHAKCYMNEQCCIISSMNLYEYSQQHNYEMGVSFSRENEPEEFKKVTAEIRLLLGVARNNRDNDLVDSDEIDNQANPKGYDKLTTSKLARKHKLKTDQMKEQLQTLGYLTRPLLFGEPKLTSKAIEAGTELRNGRNGEYWLWPVDLIDSQANKST